jgi:hypothetical protein
VIELDLTDFRRGWEPVSGKVFPSRGGDSMSKDEDRLPGKKEEQGPLAKVIDLAPLFELVIRILELVLKILRIIG